MEKERLFKENEEITLKEIERIINEEVREKGMHGKRILRVSSIYCLKHKNQVLQMNTISM